MGPKIQPINLLRFSISAAPACQDYSAAAVGCSAATVSGAWVLEEARGEGGTCGIIGGEGGGWMGIIQPVQRAKRTRISHVENKARIYTFVSLLFFVY